MAKPAELEHYVGRWWHRLEDDRLQCDLCPRLCKLRAGQRGMCYVRQNVEGELVLTTYGRSSGFCVDPIEKKPLNHFFPGSSVLSFGTAGCNLACQFCQNWDMSKAKDMDLLAAVASPSRIAERAGELGCASVAFTYNDPVIFAEYAMDTAEACRARGIKAVAVTNGYITPAARREFFSVLDAANIDLKAFTERFYHKLTLSHLEPILDTLRYVRHETDCWLEITTLLIPGWNDSDDEVRRLANWVVEELGPDVPLHFTAFHPDFRMLDTPPTPLETLRRAREHALAAGARFVYTGNLPDLEGQCTYCPGCGERVVERSGYAIGEYRLTAEGCCEICGQRIPGRFDPAGAGTWGNRRAPVVVSE